MDFDATALLQDGTMTEEEKLFKQETFRRILEDQGNNS
jgi:hypothetical protein